MKKRYSILLGVVIITSSVAWFIFQESPQIQSSVVIGNLTIPVEIADTPDERGQGLSDRASLDADSGMLFVMPRKDIYSFWMKDMRFPIDIVWISDGRVIGIEHNIHPETNLSNPRLYRPNQSVDYVLETNTGFALKNNFTIGDVVTTPSAN